MADGDSNSVILRNAMKIPLFGLGTSHFGGYNHEAVVYALRDCNYRLIDTAKRYGCEDLLQVAIKESQVPRDDIFITTKLWPSDYGTRTMEACRESMVRLGVEYLDLYLMHWPNCPSTSWNPKALREETWRSLELLYEKEIIKSIGVSNYQITHLEEMEESASVFPHVNQIEFHPYQNPKELCQYCKENKIQLEGYCPLAKGTILTDTPIAEIAKRKHRTSAQILIRWSMQNNVVTIPKSTKVARIIENSKVFDFELSEEEMTVLNSLHDNRRCVDITTIQKKIDAELPDGYKLTQ